MGGGATPGGRSALALTKQERRTLAFLSRQKSAAPGTVAGPAEAVSGEEAYPSPRTTPLGGLSQAGLFLLWAGPLGGGVPGSSLRIRELLLSQVQPWQGARPGGLRGLEMPTRTFSAPFRTPSRRTRREGS